MSVLLEGLKTLRENLNVEEERKLLDILIRIVGQHEEGDTWHGLEARQVFEPLTQAQITSLTDSSGVPQIIVKGDPPAQATYVAYPIPPNGGNGNGNGK
jgi:hypothetical protein